jgi:CheY-like chemotaxis protein
MISAEAGFRQVTTAASGWDALTLLGTGEKLFDCLLLDIDMPGMDGIELCRRLRDMPPYRDVPVIMLTAMRDMRHMDSAFRAGATDYTTKPFDVIEFGARLHLAQDRIEAQAELGPEDEAGQGGAGRQRSLELQIVGTPSLIEQRALANYLGQLNRTEIGNIVVMAVQLDQVDMIGPGVSTRSRIVALRDVATAICAVIGLENCQIAYGGHGIFLLAVQTRAIADRDIEAEINQNLAQGHSNMPETHQPLTISAGEPVQPNGKKVQRAEMAFKRAVLAVNRRKLFDRSELNSLDVGK